MNCEELVLLDSELHQQSQQVHNAASAFYRRTSLHYYFSLFFEKGFFNFQPSRKQSIENSYKSHFFIDIDNMLWQILIYDVKFLMEYILRYLQLIEFFQKRAQRASQLNVFSN